MRPRTPHLGLSCLRQRLREETYFLVAFGHISCTASKSNVHIHVRTSVRLPRCSDSLLSLVPRASWLSQLARKLTAKFTDAGDVAVALKSKEEFGFASLPTRVSSTSKRTTWTNRHLRGEEHPEECFCQKRKEKEVESCGKDQAGWDGSQPFRSCGNGAE